MEYVLSAVHFHAIETSIVGCEMDVLYYDPSGNKLFDVGRDGGFTFEGANPYVVVKFLLGRFVFPSYKLKQVWRKVSRGFSLQPNVIARILLSCDYQL